MQTDSKPNLWFFVSGSPYKGKEADFIEVNDLDWAIFLETNYKKIKNELEDFLKSTPNKKSIFKPYFNTNLVNKPFVWATIPTMIWGVSKKIMNRFPTLVQFKNQFPQVVSLSFNKLESGGRVLPHQGDTNGIYRAHLGLKVSGGLPETGFRVNNSKIAWQEGKVFAFCDAFEHEAWNNGPNERIILSVDVIRPEFIHQKNSICIKVRAFLALQIIVGWFPFLLKTPRILIAPVFLTTSLILKIPFYMSKLLSKKNKN